MTHSLLIGRTALVTGAANGIGFAIARLLAERGVRIALNDVDLDAVQQASASIGPGHLSVQADVSRDHAQQRCTRTDLNVIGMGTKAEDRQPLAGGCELQGLHDVMLSSASHSKKGAMASRLVRPFLRILAYLSAYPWPARSPRICKRGAGDL